LFFTKSAIPGGVNLQSAEVGALCLEGSQTGVIEADGVKVRGAFLLRGHVKVLGGMRMLGATIDGNLEFDGGECINPGGYAFAADGIQVKGAVFLRAGFRALGEVRLVAGTIHGDLDCRGGIFIATDGRADGEDLVAIRADGLTVAASVKLNHNFRAEGQVRLVAATIGLGLSCAAGIFVSKSNKVKAFDGNGLKVKNQVLLNNGFRSHGEVSLFGAEIGGQLDCSEGHFQSIREEPQTGERDAEQQGSVAA
jgi:hypothetical protein